MDREKVIEVVENYRVAGSFKFVLCSQMDDKKISNALKKIAPGTDRDEVVAIMDITVVGNGKDGYVMTEHEIIRKRKNVKVSIDNICAYEKMSKSVLRLTYADGTKVDFAMDIFIEFEDIIRRLIVAGGYEIGDREDRKKYGFYDPDVWFR